MNLRSQIIDDINILPEYTLNAVSVIIKEIVVLTDRNNTDNKADNRDKNKALSLDEKIIAAIKAKNIPQKTVEVDENGVIIVDKDKDPDLYDWAVNG